MPVTWRKAGHALLEQRVTFSLKRGHPLSSPIRGRVKYEKTRNQEAKRTNVIRSVMDDVKQIARFNASKLASHYIDVLRFCLRESGRDC